MLTDTGGALDVHSGFQTHITSTVFELLEIGLGSSDDTEPIDFGAVGSLPFDGMVLYITNNASQDTTVTGYTSPDDVTYFPHSTSSTNSDSDFALNVFDLVPTFDRYLRFKISNDGASPSEYTAVVGYYV